MENYVYFSRRSNDLKFHRDTREFELTIYPIYFYFQNIYYGKETIVIMKKLDFEILTH